MTRGVHKCWSCGADGPDLDALVAAAKAEAERNATLVVAALVYSLGGEVRVPRDALIDARELVLQREDAIDGLVFTVTRKITSGEEAKDG